MNMKKICMNMGAVLLAMNMTLLPVTSFSLPSLSLANVCTRSIQAAKENPAWTAAALIGASALVYGSAYVWYKIQNMSLGNFDNFSFTFDPNVSIVNSGANEESAVAPLPNSEENSVQQSQNKIGVEKYIIPEGKQEIIDLADGHGSHMNASQDNTIKERKSEKQEVTSDGIDPVNGGESEVDVSPENKKEYDDASITSASTNTQLNEKGSGSPEEDDKDSYLETVKRASVRGFKQLSTLIRRFRAYPGDQQNEGLMEQLIAAKEKIEEDKKEEKQMQEVLTRKESELARSYELYYTAESDAYYTAPESYHTAESATESEAYCTALEEEKIEDPAVTEKLEGMTESTANLDMDSLFKYLLNKDTEYAIWRNRFENALYEKNSLEAVHESIIRDIHDKSIIVEAVIIFATRNGKKNIKHYSYVQSIKEGLNTMTKKLKNIYDDEYKIPS